MASEESIEVKFRLADGSDIGPNRYSPTTTVGSLKEMILSQLPKVMGFV
ncbi:putative Ubiquitin-like domain superfamily, UBL3-like, ubiquitin domain-containing protein [Helianthus annuus]|nr:putative Ubiquitin-like domain superfamily, UBL3-like, ubiquitin domain-containing protein [Helianthus annuus]